MKKKFRLLTPDRPAGRGPQSGKEAMVVPRLRNLWKTGKTGTEEMTDKYKNLSQSGKVKTERSLDLLSQKSFTKEIVRVAQK